MITRRLLIGAAAALAVVGSIPAIAAPPIKFGVQAPITGPYAEEGQGIERAAKLLAEEQNAKGGLLGRQIEVTACDDEGKAAQAAICARQLTNDHVIAVIGSPTPAARRWRPNRSTPAPTCCNPPTAPATSCWNAATRRGSATRRRTRPRRSSPRKYLVQVRQFKKIAILTDHSSFATGLADAVEKDVKAMHGNVVDKAFINAGSQNFTPVLTKLKSLSPDVIYFSGYYSDGGLIRAQMQQLGIKAVFVGGDANQNVAFAKIAGAAAAGIGHHQRARAAGPALSRGEGVRRRNTRRNMAPRRRPCTR